MARGGAVLAPTFPGLRMQWVDVRDLADFILARCEALDAATCDAGLRIVLTPALWGREVRG